MALTGYKPPRRKHRMKHVKKSAKLANVCYDIRGPVLQKAKQMEG